MKQVGFDIWDQYRFGEVEAVQGKAYFIDDHHVRPIELVESLGIDRCYLIGHPSLCMAM